MELGAGEAPRPRSGLAPGKWMSQPHAPALQGHQQMGGGCGDEGLLGVI